MAVRAPAKTVRRQNRRAGRHFSDFIYAGAALKLKHR
jgi:hypothetical protein